MTTLKLYKGVNFDGVNSFPDIPTKTTFDTYLAGSNSTRKREDGPVQPYRRADIDTKGLRCSDKLQLRVYRHRNKKVFYYP